MLLHQISVVERAPEPTSAPDAPTPQRAPTQRHMWLPEKQCTFQDMCVDSTRLDLT
jgi:hypothetical protein